MIICPEAGASQVTSTSAAWAWACRHTNPAFTANAGCSRRKSKNLRQYRNHAKRFSLRTLRRDFVSQCQLSDFLNEGSFDMASSYSMWHLLADGQGVLLECPSRWYLGVVDHRTSMTVVLKPELCICGHDLGDLGMFLDGKVSNSTELTPLPRGIEISLSSIDTCQPYPVEFLQKVCKRTHNPEGERAK